VLALLLWRNAHCVFQEQVRHHFLFFNFWHRSPSIVKLLFLEACLVHHSEVFLLQLQVLLSSGHHSLSDSWKSVYLFQCSIDAEFMIDCNTLSKLKLLFVARNHEFEYLLCAELADLWMALFEVPADVSLISHDIALHKRTSWVTRNLETLTEMFFHVVRANRVTAALAIELFMLAWHGGSLWWTNYMVIGRKAVDHIAWHAIQ
jgi:hypothetical protein